MPLEWTAGRIYGNVTIASGSSIELSGAGYKYLSSGNGSSPAVVTNLGTVVWLGGGALYAYDSAQIYNLNQWQLAGDGNALDFCCSGIQGTFHNVGTVTKTGGTEDTSLNDITFVNSGTLNVPAGTVSLSYNTQWPDGGQISGAGRVRLTGAGYSATFAGSTILNCTMEWAGPNIQGNVRLTGPEALEWTAGCIYGSVTIASGSALELSGAGYKSLSSGNGSSPAVVTNLGTVAWLGGAALTAFDGAQIYNLNQWRLGADGAALSFCCNNPHATFFNRGTLAKVGGTNDVSLDVMLVNSGTVNVAFGSVTVPYLTQWQDGGQISGAGRVRLTGQTGPSATFAGTTTLNATLECAGANILGNGRFAGPLPLAWTSGRLYGTMTVAPGGTLELTGSSKTLSSGSSSSPAAITNLGTVAWLSGPALTAYDGARIYNSGLWRLGVAGDGFAFCCNNPIASFLNQGTLAAIGGLSANLGNIALDNPGVITADGGMFGFQNSFNNAGTFALTLTGPDARIGYPVFGLTNTVLQGTLSVSLGAGFVPANGATFAIIAGSGLAGAFQQYSLPPLPTGRGWTVDYSSTGAVLRVTDSCLAGNLLAWWPGEGSAADLLGGHSGTNSGGVTFTNGYVGQAFSFDGTNGYVAVPDTGLPAGSTPRTVEFWMKPATNAREAVIYGSYTASSAFYVSVNTNVAAIGRWGGGAVNGTKVVTDGVWHHVALTYDGGSTVKLYVDGLLDASSAFGYNTVLTGNLYLGSPVGGNTNHFAGLLDEVVIFNRALSAAEVATDFADGNRGRCAQFGLSVVQFTPLGAVTNNVDHLTLQFSQPIRTSTFTTGDVAISGPGGAVPPAGLTIQPVVPADGRSFNILVPLLTNEGPYSVSIGPNVLDLAGNPMGGGAYVAAFSLDKTGPRVLSFTPTSPTSNQVGFLEFTFSEALDGSTVNPADLQVVGPDIRHAAAVQSLASNVWRFTLDAPLSGGSYNLSLGPSIRDLAGNPMDQNQDGIRGHPSQDVFQAVLAVVVPDLVPTALSAPGLAQMGQSVPLVFTMTNQGLAPAPGPWQNTVFLALDNSGSGAQSLGYAVFNGTLAPGASISVTQTVILPGGVSGARFLGVQLDAGGQVVERTKTNNTAYAALPLVISAADLQVQKVSAPGSAQFGQTISVSFTITNVGSAATFAIGEDRLYLSTVSNSLSGATLLETLPSTVLTAGAAYSRTQAVALPLTSQLQAGTFFLVVAADAMNAQPESNEANNTGFRELALTKPPLPDLVITQVNAPTLLAPGSSFEFTWTVANLGAVPLDSESWAEKIVLTNETVGALGVAEFLCTNSLAPGGSIIRTQRVDMPLNLPPGNYQIVLTTDSRSEIIESNESNNSTNVTSLANVAAQLVLQIEPGELTEGGPSNTATVTRNGDFSQPLIVTVTNSLPGKLVCAPNVIIPAGQASASFVVFAPTNAIQEGDQYPTVLVMADGYYGAFMLFTLHDSTVVPLTLSLASGEVFEGLPVLATVSRPTSDPEDLLVVLNSSLASQVGMPGTVTIPAGQQTVGFSITATENGTVDLTTTNLITAAVYGYVASTAALGILDNDLPLVTLQFADHTVSEGAGTRATTATLTRSFPGAADLVVELEGSLSNALILPAVVTIPAGALHVSFPVATVDNAVVDGPKLGQVDVFVRATGSLKIVSGGVGDSLTVQDDDGPTLQLKLATGLVSGGLSSATTGTVSRNTATNAALVVSLTTSDASEAGVPPTVTIPAGALSADFSVQSFVNPTNHGNQRVTFTASAAGLTAGTASLVVSDVNLPDLVVTRVTLPASAPSESFFSPSYRVENHGRVVASNFITRVFLSKDSIPSADDPLLSQYTFPGSLTPGLFFEQALTARLPVTVGKFWVIVTVDPLDTVAETLEDNNALVSAQPIEVTAAYTATVQTSVQTALANTPIPLSGSAFRQGTSEPVPFALVNLFIYNQGTKRVISALTDVSGNFNATFTPLPGEAGVYQIGAAHPGESLAAVQDDFTLLGFRADPASVSLNLIEGESVAAQVRLLNLSDVPLSGLSASLVSPPSVLNINLTAPASALAGGGTNVLNFTVAANTGSAGAGSFGLRFTTTEGATVEVPVQFTVIALRPQLVADPGMLYAGMLRGAQTSVEFELQNLGGAASGPITVSLPSFPWLSMAQTNPLPSLAPGESNRVTLVLTPASDLDLVPFDGSIACNASGASLSLPFEFRTVSYSLGDLQVLVQDEYSFYAEGNPSVTNASVTVLDAVTHTAVTNGVTGPDGVVVFPQLPEGYYELVVTAVKHSTDRKTTLVLSGRTNQCTSFISRQTVEYIWTVVPTEIQDVTHIVIETTFETVVPIPVVTVEPSVIDLADMAGDVMQVDVKIANHGLIAAENLRLEFDGHPDFTFTPLITDVGTLPAESSLVIPLIIQRLSGSHLSAGNGFGPVGARKDPSRANGVTGAPCGAAARTIHELKCGKMVTSYVTPITFLHAGDCGSWGGGTGGGGGGGGGGGDYGYGGGGSLSGPGSGWFGVPRTFEQKEECQCDKESFVSVCQDMNADVALLSKFAKNLSEKIKLGSFKPEVSVKASGTMQVCQCCTDEGTISSKYKGTMDASAELVLKYYLVGGEFDSPSFSYGPGSAIVKAEAGVPVTLKMGAKITGSFEIECGDLLPKYCVSFTPSAGVGGAAVLAGSVEFRDNPASLVPDHKEGASISASIEASASGTVQYCRGSGLSGEVCFDGVTAKASATLTHGRLSIGPSYSVVLADKSCWPKSNSTAQVEAELDSEFEQLLQNANMASFKKLATRHFTPGTGNSLPRKASAGICARVKLRLDQDLILSRNAFNATLELINRDAENSLEDVQITVQIYDALGQPANELFGFKDPALSGLTAVGGPRGGPPPYTGAVPADSTGSASFIMVPTSAAAPDGPTPYSVGGILSYTVAGLPVSVPLARVPITVLPDPRLFVKYFHQRDVLSDDPFTPQVEPAVPYSLAVMVENRGQGQAKDVHIVSSQPQIVENEKGLLIDFKIIATEVDGQNLTPSLTASFGLIPPGTNAIGRWLLTSTLQGLFLDYKATFEHVDSLGKTNLSLVDEVTIHEMIHLVQAPAPFDDGRCDFLVNDDRDPDDLPDHVYLSDGTTNAVQVVQAATVDAPPNSGNLQAHINATVPGGWLYLDVPDPANGQFRLTRVVRSDGTEVRFGYNAWTTDRTFIGQGQRPINENKLHIFDYDSPGTYTLYYTNLPAGDTAAPYSSVAALPSSSYPTFPVFWSGDDQGGSGVAFFDIYVSVDGGPFAPWLQHTALSGSLYGGTMGSTYAFYSVAADNTGNREPAPLAPDAQTLVNLVNTPPVILAATNVVIDEGQTIAFTVPASDTNVGQILLFSLAGAPSGVLINPVSGLVTWTTGEGSGPSTNRFDVVVTDTGLPALSATCHVSVIVHEVNQSPSLAAIADYAINEGFLLTFACAASDPDLPQNHLTFRLGAGAPAGARVNATNGMFTWRPTTVQGPSTNLISVIVTDDGVPSLYATQRFSVIVRDTLSDFVFRVGSTNVLAGESNTVPLVLQAGADLTNLSLIVSVPASRLTNLVLRPLAAEVSQASLMPMGQDLFNLSLNLDPAQAGSSLRSVATLDFLAVSNYHSASVTLGTSNLLGWLSSGTLLTNGRAVSGRVIVVGREPVVDLGGSPLALILYGRPGAGYALQGSTNPVSGLWTEWTRFTLTNRLVTLPVAGSNAPVFFYRAWEYKAGTP